MMHDSAYRIKVVTRVTFLGLVGNALLGIVKVWTGWWGGSQALLADGIHTFSDMITDIPILIGARYWEEPADNGHQYGHRRIELMVTLLIGVFLALVAFGICIHALQQFATKKYTTPELLPLTIAIISIGVKEYLYRIGLKWGKRIGSSALIANAWHHRSDALSSIPTACAIAGAVFFQSLQFLDLLGAVVVASFIMKASFDIVKPSFDKLVDRGANAETISAIESRVKSDKDVIDCHNIRTRFITPTELSIDIHVLMDPDITVREGHDIATRVKWDLINTFDYISDVVVHMEPPHE